jgi:hypothetical protein
MKEIRFSDHGKFKIDILANHGLNISPEFIIDTICNSDKVVRYGGFLVLVF